MLRNSYIGDTDSTMAMFDDDGFIKTGDLAYLDSQDYIIDGRAKSDGKPNPILYSFSIFLI